jgi:hypothetical protein
VAHGYVSSDHAGRRSSLAAAAGQITEPSWMI